MLRAVNASCCGGLEMAPHVNVAETQSKHKVFANINHVSP